MPPRRPSKPQVLPAGPDPATSREWVGGRVVYPFWIASGEAYPPDIIVWLEMPKPVIVGFHLVERDGKPVKFGETLLVAMRKPMEGKARRPGRVRVADEELAGEVRRVLPEVVVTVAATPEIDDVIEAFGEMAMRSGGPESPDHDWPSLLESGRFDAGLVAKFFTAAGLIHRLAPWKVVSDGDVIRVDIPEHGVSGGCLLIIGQLGEDMGLVLFPSLEGRDRFVEAGMARREPIDLGTTLLSLEFEADLELPATVRKRIKSGTWSVEGKDAFPLLVSTDRHGNPQRIEERDVRVMTACAMSLASCFARHRELFQPESDDDPICESYLDENDVETRLTVPYEAWELFEETERPKRMQGKSRGARRPPASEVPPAAAGFEEGLLVRLNAFATKRFGKQWMAETAALFHDPDDTRGLFIPWAYYGQPIRGKTLPEWYLADPGNRPTAEERAWLTAQLASWLSVWEVVDVNPGTSVTLVDALSGQTRLVREMTASKLAVRRDHLLANVLDHGGTTTFGGVHPRALQPSDADFALSRVRQRLGRKGVVPIKRLREEPISRALILSWEMAVAAADERRARPPVLTNTDGHLLKPTIDRFSFLAVERPDILRRLDAEADLEREDDPGSRGEATFVITREGNSMHRGMESTVIGRIRVAKTKLRIEANSVERADALRRRFQAGLASLIRFDRRVHEDPPTPPVGPRSASLSAEMLRDPELAEITRVMKAKHYADWIDHPLPALGNRTPREVARSKAGRREVDLLLRDMENHESRAPEAQRYDFTPIRRELGLEE